MRVPTGLFASRINEGEAIDPIMFAEDPSLATTFITPLAVSKPLASVRAVQVIVLPVPLLESPMPGPVAEVAFTKISAPDV